MKNCVRYLAVAAVALLHSALCFDSARATPISPIAVTGWSADVIAENTASYPGAGVGGGTNSQFAAYVFYEAGAPAGIQGLPTSGSFTSDYNANTTFQFQPYTANNAMIVGSGATTGTVTLATPAAYGDVALLDEAQGSAGQTWNATLTFVGGATFTTATFSDPDWTYSGGNNALSSMGLMSGDLSSWSSASVYGGTLNMFEHDVMLAAPYSSDMLSSITLNYLSGSGPIALFAVSAAVPEPASWTLAGLGAAGALAAARRRKK